jgi:hypothetical protein
MIKLFLCITLLLATAAPSWAAVVRLLENFPGNYRIEAEGLEAVAAFDLTLYYDPATLLISSVTQGAMLQGAMFAANPNQPGLVRIGVAAIQPISGSGTLATLGGAVKGSSPVILSLSAKLADEDRRSLPVSIGPLPSSGFDDSSESEHADAGEQTDSPSSTTGSRDSSGSVSVGKVIVSPWGAEEPVTLQPTEIDEPYEPLPEEAEASAQEISPEREQPSTPYVEKRQFGFTSVLEAFEVYDGPRTLTDMGALFQRETAGFEQYPAIVLADGETSAEIELWVESAKEPSIALKNARLLKAKFVAENRFLVRCIPKGGAMSSKVLILGGERIVAIPLTVAPPVPLAGLDVQPDEPLPKIDLDGDGESTWRDDYILVANLLERERKARKLLEDKVEK